MDNDTIGIMNNKLFGQNIGDTMHGENLNMYNVANFGNTSTAGVSSAFAVVDVIPKAKPKGKGKAKAKARANPNEDPNDEDSEEIDAPVEVAKGLMQDIMKESTAALGYAASLNNL
eukprot:5779763-Pyramimonas_sp.AAC.1